MGPYTYAVGEFVTVESDVEVFLFDVTPGDRVLDPDVVIREEVGSDLTAERTGGRIRVTVPASLPTEKTGSTEPVEFTKVLTTAIDLALLQRGATLAFGAVLQTPDGVGVGLFGDSGSGKSTAAFRLARQHGYRLLADDLLIIHGREVHPFPRYLNLPRDVPCVERWFRSTARSTDHVRRWDDQLDVPRALVSDVVPGRVELDYAVLVDPAEQTARTTTSPETVAVSTERAVADLVAWNRTNLDGWTSHPTVRGSDEPAPDRRGAIRAAITGSDCYRIASPRECLPQSVAALLQRERRFEKPPSETAHPHERGA